MIRLILELLLGPILIACATLSSRRWNPRAGGVVSAFPAVVGPVLLIGALGHGRRFAADEADGTLIGLVSLAGFVVAYGRMATRVGWRPSLIAGWAAAALAAAAGTGGTQLGFGLCLAAAGVSLLLAHRALPLGTFQAGPTESLPDALPLRMGLTALLVLALSLAAALLGPLVGGVLAALPVLASLLAVFTHRREGAGAVTGMLRGLLEGMIGFVAFCAVIAVGVVPAGVVPAFGTATVTAVLVAVLLLYRPIGAGRETA